MIDITLIPKILRAIIIFQITDFNIFLSFKSVIMLILIYHY